MGVRMAVNKAFINLRRQKTPLFTHGPLIHNPQVTHLLREKGVTPVDEKNLPDVKGGAVMIRAHGITPTARKEIEEAGLCVIDATCPKVLRIHHVVKRHHALGYRVIVVGDKDHPEVAGIIGYTQGTGTVISSPDEASSLPDAEKILMVVQTTFEVGLFQKIRDAVFQRYRGIEIKVYDTICDSTKKRQNEVAQLARKVDAMVVVGGKNSGNTKRLFEVAQGTGIPAYWVEDETELDPEDFVTYARVGLTAGASTPNWVIMRVADFLSGIDAKGPYGKKIMGGYVKRLVRFTVLSNVYAGIAAGGLAAAASLLLGIDSFWIMPLISGLFIFSMLVLNRIQDPETLKFNDPIREKFFRDYKRIFIISGTLAAFTALILSYTISVWALLFLALASIVGVAYSVKIIPRPLERYVRYRRLKDIPASKTFFVAAAWAGVSSAMPYFSSPEEIPLPSLFLVFFWCFLLVFIRAVLYDIKDIQGDAVVGRETMPIVIGKERTQRLVLALAIVSIIIIALSTYAGLVTSLGYWLIGISFYSLLSLYLYHRRVIFQGIVFEMVVDLEFILAGILSALWFFVTS
jgi:4-hydroxy-3-methylbut-2-enyl diphosphate reductase